MRGGALGLVVVAWLTGACSGGLGAPQPNETEAREIAQRYVVAHLGELVRSGGAWSEGCPAVTSEMLDSAYYTVTAGTVAPEPAVRVTAELAACEVDVAVVLVLDGGTWTAVAATVSAHDGTHVDIGRPVAFTEPGSSGQHEHHHHHHHHH